MQLGIDEVGRGAWAGPLLVVGVLADPSKLAGLRDSKILTAKTRQSKLEFIKLNSKAIEMCWIAAPEIDDIGLATAMDTAVKQVFSPFSKLNVTTIIDGNVNYLASFKKTAAVVKADDMEPCVSAASIIAKCARDAYMSGQAKKYPAYGFERHVGYGTKLHKNMLKKHGVCNLHRTSYKPVAEIIYEQANRRQS